jgi:Leucine-rich repeat (LRR) protein
VNGSVCKNDSERLIQNQETYDIEKCTNTEIDLGAESARASLTTIYAFNNQISEISDDTFKLAKQLTSIDLRENKIERISVGAFEDQAKLQFLYLKQNKLTRIEVGTFDSLVELKDLWLQNNQILLIEKGLFDQNTKLVNLYLNENKIVAIESTVFKKLNAIKSLTLSWNLCVKQDFNANQFNQDFNCFVNYDTLSKPHQDHYLKLENTACLNENGVCRRGNMTIHQRLYSCESKPEDDISKTELYVLIALIAIEFSIIIILLWKLKSKNDVESSQGESEIAVEGNPNENNLIYAALDLKPSNRTPIKTDQVIYSELQKVDRPNESVKK